MFEHTQKWNMYAHLQLASLHRHRCSLSASTSLYNWHTTKQGETASRATLPLASATARMLLAMGLFKLTARGFTAGPTASFSIYLPCHTKVSRMLIPTLVKTC